MSDTFKKEIAQIWAKNELVVIDDILPLNVIDSMRYWALTTEYDPEQKYAGGYRTVDFGNNQKTNKKFPIPELKWVSEYLLKLPICKNLKFSRGWFFIHQNECRGVGPHADPASININIWVTPNHCVKDKGKNGLIVWDTKHPEDWTWDQYNRQPEEITELLQQEGAKERRIDYKYNRATCFNSAFFHSTDHVSMLPQHHQKRINFTFMYIDKNKNDEDYT